MGNASHSVPIAVQISGSIMSPEDPRTVSTYLKIAVGDYFVAPTNAGHLCHFESSYPIFH